jgi:hypothetical protein
VRRSVTAAACAALGVLGVTVVWITTQHRHPPIVAHGPASGLATTLAIELFRAPDSVAMVLAATMFAESLAAHLERMPGLEVRVVTGTIRQSTDFTLRGNITMQGGRLVIVSRLYERDEEPPIWTATFWRDRVATSNIADELAADMAEALYGHLARTSVTTTRGRS